MRHTTPAMVTVLVAVLVVTAAPVQSSNHDDVASIHETDSDFASANTLDNVVVSGTGTSATADLLTRPTIDDFEDGDASSTPRSEWGSWSGDTGSWTATTNALNGTHSGEMAPGTTSKTVSTSRSSGETRDVRWVWNGEQGTEALDKHSFLFYESGTQIFFVNFVMNGDINVDGNIAGSWSGNTTYRVRVSFDFPNDEATVYLDGSTLGTFALNQPASQYDQFQYTLDNDDASTAYSGRVDDIQTIVEPAEGQYISDTHDTEQIEQAFVDLSLTDVTATVEWQYHDGSSWQVADTSTYTTSGNKTVDVSGHESATQWRVNVTYDWNRVEADAAASIDDEGVLFESSTPSVDDNSLSPDNTDLTTTSVTLEADVNDSDFATAQGDTLTVSWEHKGPDDSSYSTLSTTTVTSNTTATTTESFVEGGTHDWRVTVEDEHGNTVASSSANFTVPSTVEIREERPEHAKLDTVDVEVTFYEDQETNPTIVNRTVTNGELDLTGLPAGATFSVAVEASNYHTRTVIIDGIYEQDTIYMLNTTASSIESTFVLEDLTGRFPPRESELVVQRAINDSVYDPNGDGFGWTAVAGDELGADRSFQIDLQQDQRYRLVVRNDENDSRVLGAYTSSKDETVNLPVGRVTIEGDGPSGWAFQASIVEDSGQQYLKVVYRDPEEDTDSLQFNVTRRDNPSTVVQANTTVSGPVGSHVELIPINNPDNEKSYTVNYWIDRDSNPDQEISGQRHSGGVPDIASDWDIDSRWLEAIGWVAVVAFTGLTVIINGRLGAIMAVSVATMLTWLGVIHLPTPALGLAAATAVVFAVAGVRG